MRSYSDQERAEAVGLALAIGADKAAEKLGIPRRNISRWLRLERGPVRAAIAATRTEVAARLWEGVVAGSEAVVNGLRDPKARLSDKASALRIVVEAHALISGGPTSRTANVNVNVGGEDLGHPGLTWEEESNLAQWFNGLSAASDDELRAWVLSDEGQTIIAALRAGGEAASG